LHGLQGGERHQYHFPHPEIRGIEQASTSDMKYGVPFRFLTTHHFKVLVSISVTSGILPRICIPQCLQWHFEEISVLGIFIKHLKLPVKDRNCVPFHVLIWKCFQ
jgi:hypothetical protein